ncbi:GNAT family protein [Citrobacter koseri]|uniref:GNAT family N-acetyltransferase n=1 Tax=Citrobacter koseri TaxID=545 RepID=UPI002941EC9B|nr:GNAT family protein [Citrobacter koseri]MEB2769830.1 GNAT family protein [Citrobacter koseri]WOJ24366.1 GNAT family protein [Citrobacter koseri]
MKELNIFGQYVGRHLEGNLDFILPDTRQLSGRYCHLQPLATYHCDDLYQGWHSIEDPRDWTYLPDERPETRQATFDYIKRIISQGGISYYAIIENKSAFDVLKYRRCEWQTDTLNHAGMNAAERIGFRKEGILRDKQIIKSRSVDIATYSIISAEWPKISSAISVWLRTENLDERGHQIHPLRHYLAESEV